MSEVPEEVRARFRQHFEEERKRRKYNFWDLDIDFHYERLRVALEDLQRETTDVRAVALMTPLRNWVEMRIRVRDELRAKGHDIKLVTAKPNRAMASGLRLGTGIATLQATPVAFGGVQAYFSSVSQIPRDADDKDKGMPELVKRKVGFLEWLSAPVILYNFVEQETQQKMQGCISRLDTVELLANAFQALHTGVKDPPLSKDTQKNRLHVTVIRELMNRWQGGCITEAHAVAASIAKGLLDGLEPIYGKRD